MRVLLTALLILVCFVTPAVAKGQSQPLTFNDHAPSQIFQNMDTQPGAVNRTGCVANDQDNKARLGIGDVAAGQTVDDTLCLIADYGSSANSLYPKVVVFRVYAPSNTLAVTLSNDVGDQWTSPPNVAWGNLRLWTMCVRDPVAQVPNLSHYSELSSYWSFVPGTNIYGQIVQYTLHVTSPERKTRKVSAYFEVAHGDGPGPLRVTYQTPCS